MEKFLDIYGSLPRAGPGSDEITRRAYSVMHELPAAPRILDVGCGPGMQTIELLRLSRGTVVALDLLPQMLRRVEASAAAAGVSDRLVTVEQDMNSMTFPASSFDVIWSEGSIYLIGFEKGLTNFPGLLKPGGFLCVSEAVWLKPNPPLEVVEFWKEYPEIDFVEAKLRIIEQAGLELIDHFILPPEAWEENYYRPMWLKIAEKEREWEGDAEGLEVLRAAKDEISVFRRFSDYYTYAFFVMKKL
ncbi:MAG: class I SAM-dependent methyltransferase [Planctomyces sp.]|nr:class I SAM-dependent methyltransferase [Planctomyces sp.]